MDTKLSHRQKSKAKEHDDSKTKQDYKHAAEDGRNRDGQPNGFHALSHPKRDRNNATTTKTQRNQNSFSKTNNPHKNQTKSDDKSSKLISKEQNNDKMHRPTANEADGMEDKENDRGSKQEQDVNGVTVQERGETGGRETQRQHTDERHYQGREKDHSHSKDEKYSISKSKNHPRNKDEGRSRGKDNKDDKGKEHARPTDKEIANSRVRKQPESSNKLVSHLSGKEHVPQSRDEQSLKRTDEHDRIKRLSQSTEGEKDQRNTEKPYDDDDDKEEVAEEFDPEDGNENSLKSQEARGQHEKTETKSKSSTTLTVKQEKTKAADEDSLQMFLSTDNMEREDEYQASRATRRAGRPQVVVTRQYSDAETKRKHEEVVRRILEQFDLEETKNKYRNSNAYEYRRNGKSLADFRFRSELIRMMGTDVIRLSDQSWSTRFQERLKEDYERQLNEQAHNLADTEKRRLHRLRVEGIISDSVDTGADSNDVMRRAFTRSDSLSARSRKLTCINRGSLASPRRDSDVPHHDKETSGQESSSKEQALGVRRQHVIYRPPPTLAEVGPSTTDQSEADQEGKRHSARSGSDRHKSGRDPSSSQQDDMEGSYSLSIADSDVLLDESRILSPEEKRKRRYKHLPPHIAQLYDVETVAGLYKMAERLIGIPRRPTVEKAKDNLSENM